MILVSEADIFFTESLRILAERLSQSKIGLPLRLICYNSPPEEVGVFSTEINYDYLFWQVKDVILHKYAVNDFTLVQNQFIDNYMISANGEFVKVYLYLLRCSTSSMELTISSIADALNHTENDVRRALSYWERLHILQLTYDSAGNLTDITFVESQNMEAASQGRLSQYASSLTDLQNSPGKLTVSVDRKKELSGQEEVKQLLYIAEQYLAKQLSSTEVNHILYFYDELHFSSDLIEYLIEYCVSKGKRSINYIRKVALEWAARGVTTVKEAKEDSNFYHRDYYTILNAFGIRGRGPAKAEADFMAAWFQEYGFTTDIILEAVNRTITRIHTPSFEYADRILQEWKSKGVKHAADIASLPKPVAQTRRSSAPSTKPAGNFGFPQRDYDFDQLEQQLLDC